MSARETSLWAGVIYQALEDATSCRTSNAQDLDRQIARTWFRQSNSDFIEVCNLAGLDPDAVLERARIVFDKFDAAIANGATFELSPLAEKQAPPKREPRRYTHNGMSLTLREWSERTGLTVNLLSHRLRYYTLEQAIDPDFKVKFSRQGNRAPKLYSKGRTPKLHTFNGETKSLTAWALMVGIDKHTLATRLRKGWSIELALTMPKNAKLPRSRGVASNFRGSSGTGAGSVEQETPNLGISE